MSLRRWLLSLLLLPAAAGAQVPAAPAAPAAPALLPTEVVDAFQAAMTGGDRKAVVQYLAPDLVIYEQGFVERGRDAYAEGSMPNDMTFASLVQRQALSREAWEDGNVAWVQTLSSITGLFGDQKLSLVNTETLVLRRTDVGWKIVHIHRSAHPRGPDEDLPEPLHPAAKPASTPPASTPPVPPPAPEPLPAAEPAPEPAPAPAPEPAPETAPPPAPPSPGDN